ncbi:hypothetical protein [Campylobacter portucalensis]|nr:hypothetical protein [Campylobacter portucalensis]
MDVKRKFICFSRDIMLAIIAIKLEYVCSKNFRVKFTNYAKGIENF